jgi:ArsR family transcriptional regulator
MNINIVEFLKQLSDQTRLRSLMLLNNEGELCVCEITHALGLSQPKISRHLAQMRETNIVQARREGIWIYYSLHRDLPDWARTILDSSSVAVESIEPFISDLSSLSNMPDRPAAACCA